MRLVGGEPFVVELKEDEGRLDGELAVGLVSRDKGRFCVRFQPWSGGKPIDLAPKLTTPVSSLQMVGQTRDRLARGDSVVLRLTFTLPADAKPEDVRGLLRIRVGSGQPLVTEVRPMDPPAATPRYSFEQEELTVTVEQDTPWSDDGEATRKVGIRDATPEEDPPSGALATTLVALGDGTARTKVDPPPKGAATVKPAAITVYRANGSGSGTGTLILDGEGKRLTLKVTARMRDMILWPLLAILLGALLGQMVPQLWARNRRAWIVRGALKDGVDDYDNSRRGRQSNPPRLEDIDEEVGESRAFWWGIGNLRWVSGSPGDGAADIYSRLGREQLSHEFEDVVEEAEALLTLIANWRAMDAALRELWKAHREVGSLPGLTPLERRPRFDTKTMFTSAMAIPRDTDAGKHAVDRIKGQTCALGYYASAMPLHKELKARGGQLDAEAAQELYRHHPLTIYRRAGDVLTRSAEAAKKLVSDLENAYDHLRALSERFPKPPTVTEPAGIPDDARVVAYAAIGGPAGEVFTWLWHTIVPTRVPSTEEIVAGVKTWDWLVFGISLVVAALAYLLPLYAGKDWGSAFDYLTALAAGFAGTVAINAALSPLTRSYAAFPPKEPATAPGPAA